ncbi:hypothetical protein JTB14_020416 [Gonioctena quinquepunctata]|nr:hypothetical protein JTB14_020416 [Gonioctena quinquepunctata]
MISILLMTNHLQTSGPIPYSIISTGNGSRRSQQRVKKPITHFHKDIIEDLFDSMTLCMNMKEVKDTGKSLKHTVKELRTFIGCHMIITLYGLPSIKLIWSREFRLPIIADNISRNCFSQLRTRLRLVNDDAITNKQKNVDRFW